MGAAAGLVAPRGQVEVRAKTLGGVPQPSVDAPGEAGGVPGATGVGSSAASAGAAARTLVRHGAPSGEGIFASPTSVDIGRPQDKRDAQENVPPPPCMHSPADRVATTEKGGWLPKQDEAAHWIAEKAADVAQKIAEDADLSRFGEGDALDDKIVRETVEEVMRRGAELGTVRSAADDAPNDPSPFSNLSRSSLLILLLVVQRLRAEEEAALRATQEEPGKRTAAEMDQPRLKDEAVQAVPPQWVPSVASRGTAASSPEHAAERVAEVSQHSRDGGAQEAELRMVAARQAAMKTSPAFYPAWVPSPVGSSPRQMTRPIQQVAPHAGSVSATTGNQDRQRGSLDATQTLTPGCVRHQNPQAPQMLGLFGRRLSTQPQTPLPRGNSSTPFLQVPAPRTRASPILRVESALPRDCAEAGPGLASSGEAQGRPDSARHVRLSLFEAPILASDSRCPTTPVLVAVQLACQRTCAELQSALSQSRASNVCSESTEAAWKQGYCTRFTNENMKIIGA